jgi:replication initiation protein RepC
MTLNHFSALPAHPRHVSPAADSYRVQFNRPPALDDKGMLHGQVLAAFKSAARYMGLRGNILIAIDYFFGLTRPQDWTGDAQPIVWPSAREQCEAMGLSLSRVKFLNRRLIDLGLIIAKDSPTGVRWGRRNHNGQIIEAYGFDLSPLAHRVAEFTRIRDAGRADDALRAQLRRRKTVAIRSIGQILRTAAEAELDHPSLYALAEGYFGIVEGLEPTADRVTLERVVAALEALRDRVHALYRDLVGFGCRQDGARADATTGNSSMEMEKTNPARSEFKPPNNNYKPTNHPSECKSSETSSSDFGNHPDYPAPKEPGEAPIAEQVPEIRVPTVKPNEVIQLAPALRLFLSEDLERIDMQRAIGAVIRAAEACAFQDLGISRPLWADAQQVMGLWPATLAVMLVAAKDPDYFSRTPAHYFAGMVEKARLGTLRLDRSIWGLRTRAETAGGKA